MYLIKYSKYWAGEYQLTSFFSIFVLISLASVKNASSTWIEALALVSMNLIPYSIASCSPLSLVTCNTVLHVGGSTAQLVTQTYVHGTVHP